MAASGRRWFPRIRPEYMHPSSVAVGEVSLYAQSLYKSKDGEKVRQVIESREYNERIINTTYFHVVQSWLKENGPSFFLEPDLMDAITSTDALSSVKGSDIKTVYPGGLFLLPRNKTFISSQTGDCISCIFYRILEPGSDLEVLLNGEKPSIALQAKNRCIFIMGFWEKASDISSFTLSLSKPDKYLSETIDEGRKKLSFGFPSRLESPEELLTEAYYYGNWAASLVANLMLIMQSYPKYLEKIEDKKHVRQHFKDKPLPSSFLIKRSTAREIHRTVVPDSYPEYMSTGKKQSPHWRPGHWRRQPHGDRWELENPDSKIIILDDGRHAHMKWILPVFIGIEGNT